MTSSSLPEATLLSLLTTTGARRGILPLLGLELLPLGLQLLHKGDKVGIGIIETARYDGYRMALSGERRPRLQIRTPLFRASAAASDRRWR